MLPWTLWTARRLIRFDARLHVTAPCLHRAVMISTPQIFLPGSTLGVMGGGQLGRMFAIAARRMGYRVHTFSPDEDTPAGQLADVEVAAGYGDEAAVREFARGVDVLTFEFENIPVESVAWASEHCVVRPAGRVLHICQHRLREKEFLRSAGAPLPRFFSIETFSELAAALREIGGKGVLKTASFGYDGKGQQKIDPNSDLQAVWQGFEEQPAVLEAWAPFEKEISVLIARGIDGETMVYPVCENMHRNHILDVTFAPAAIPEAVAQTAMDLARQIAESLELIGLLAVEMFLLRGGEILVNELAPRPHNSGHFSFDACVTSQFEQQLRAVCGLPLGSVEILKPAAMANLLGDEWGHGEPRWVNALAIPELKLHLYGKGEPRPGRKMGHLVAFGETTQEAVARVRSAREALQAR